MMSSLTLIALVVPLATIGGCCPPVDPTSDTVKTWVEREIPVGSSEDQVRRFCSVHGFDYGDVTPSTGHAARRVGGCEALKPIVLIDFEYDKEHRISGVNVQGISMLP